MNVRLKITQVVYVRVFRIFLKFYRDVDIKAKKLIKNVSNLLSLCYYKNVELKGDLL